MPELNRRELAAAAAGGVLVAAAAETPGPPLAPPDRQPPDLKLPQPVRKAGYAIVGLGKLSVEEILPAFGSARRSRAAALISGHPDKARQLAQVYGVAPGSLYGYDDYRRLRDDKDVDIVYIVLPNSMHADHTIRALEAGKHVLCEKPMATTPAECERMIAAAKAANRKLMIAYRIHFEPHNLRAVEAAKGMGGIRSFASTNAQTTTAPNIRLSKALGGGPVGDTGVYSFNTARMFLNEEPVEVTAREWRPAGDPRFREVPASVSYTLRYPSGVVAHCDTSFNAAESRFYRVTCADGVVHMDSAFSYHGQQLRLTAKDGTQIPRIRAIDQFAAEMDHFSDVVLDGGTVRTPGEMGLADQRIIAAIGEAARTGRPVRL
ncbi:Gfo/Idh/MocA family protein [Glacieibacterium frigidum]|uniref:Gfo/Idh/MocA family oxidoreductase n=1 Tax=Glacieibacterium frigidum TaxID=2593303 RepID=A0A552U7N8_9SPHN|nr:Gfo/Idh/MocA family oxidoreductase [Glacieibacterium frigidum]TRW14179.1 Gfo/Idh/MocA family oxidoreductase [Glacieibacterium frigidum]